MNGERLAGIGLVAGTVLAVAGAMLYARAQIADEVARDARHCPVEMVHTKRWTAVLADWTDRFTPGQRDALKAAIDRLAERMGRDEGLSLHVITAKPEEAGEPWQGFAYCKPRDPNGVNPLTETASFVRKAYEQSFGQPLAAALDQLVKGGEAPQSPILEAIDAAMWTPRFRAAPERRLVIFSDLLQHTAGLSHLRGGLPDPCVVATSAIGKQLQGRLEGVTVVLHYTINPAHRSQQGAAHLQWWSRLLYRLGAEAVLDGERPMPKAAKACAAPARKGAG